MTWVILNEPVITITTEWRGGGGGGGKVVQWHGLNIYLRPGHMVQHCVLHAIACGGIAT